MRSCCAGVSLQVSNMARAMVINYGFSDIGPWSLLDPSAQSPDMIMRMMARNSVSENLQQRIDVAVKSIANEAYDKAITLVSMRSRYGAPAPCVTLLVQNCCCPKGAVLSLANVAWSRVVRGRCCGVAADGR